MSTIPQEHLDAINAAADLVARAGGKKFELGHLEDDVPIHEARWWASAVFNGAKVIIDEQPAPALACELLARKLLDGGMCTHCRRVVRIRPDGYVEPAWNLGKGSKACGWQRVGPTWKRGCE